MRNATAAALVAAISLGCAAGQLARPSPISPTSPAASASALAPTPTPRLTPPSDWPTAAPEAEGFDSSVLAERLITYGEGGGGLLHSLQLIRHDNLVLDAYLYPYDRSTYHDVRSVTKSITTTLIGIAEGQGLLDLDATLLSFFPDRTVANRDARKAGITVRHLASMSSGLRCSVANDEQTLKEMVARDDFVQFALDLPMADEPGTTFSYCSPGMHLLSAILTAVTGMSEADYAAANLFGPLGIEDYYWPADAQGYSYGWSELALHPTDTAKIGLVFLHQGQWAGTQVVPAAWVAAATQRQIGTGSDWEEDYGYGWWISRPGQEIDSFRAYGDRGQRVIVFPAIELVLVVHGSGYELGQLTDFISESVTNDWQALPDDPAGVEQLNAVLARLAAGPPAGPPATLPATATRVSGQTINFEPGAPIRSVRLDFDKATEATMAVDVVAESEPRIMVVGLAGRSLPSLAGRPIVARGEWSTETTFDVRVEEGPGLNVYHMVLSFDGDSVLIEVIGVEGLTGLVYTGRIAN